MTASGDLDGLRVVVTRSIEQSAPLTRAIEAAAGVVVPFPLLQIQDPPHGLDELREALATLRANDWLAVTSPNGAERVVRSIGAGVEGMLAVVGDGTARVFADAGWPADLVPPVATAQGMVDAFPTSGSGNRVLVVQGDAAGPTLVDGLRSAGWQVDVTVAYANIEPETTSAQEDAAAHADVVVFASPSAVSRYVDRVGARPERAVCIGPVTAPVAADLGFAVTVAEEPTVAGLVDAIRRTNR